MINFKNIKLLVLDVDGILTDGSIIVDSAGVESRCFNVLDGLGIKLWKKSGRNIAIISGGGSSSVVYRASKLGIHIICQNCSDKLVALKNLLAGPFPISQNEVVYMGDDLTDIASMEYVGFSITVPNAVSEVILVADYTTSLPGGKGAVRDAIKELLVRAGEWEEVVKDFRVIVD